MNGRRTYLDHNATSPLRPEAAAAMLAAMETCGNPSSVHAEGRRARAIIETAREQVAALVNAKPLEVVFTSGATEANAWVIGAGGWDTILSSGVEHDSVRGPVAASNAQHLSIGVSQSGIAEVDDIARFASTDARADGRTLVALQLANNETGVLQPVTEVAEFVHGHELTIHSDAVQAAGKVPVDFKALGVDTMSISGHKLGGPAGVGALIIRDGLKLGSLITGGGQERRRRAGTENLIGIAGFGAAAAAAKHGLAGISLMTELRDRLEARIKAMTPGAVIIGAGAPRLPNTTSLALPGSTAETLVIKLDLAGISVSAGAACSSGKVGVSHVLAAMGLPVEIAAGAIRLSLGWSSTEADVTRFIEVWGAIARPRAARAVA